MRDPNIADGLQKIDLTILDLKEISKQVILIEFHQGG